MVEKSEHFQCEGQENKSIKQWATSLRKLITALKKEV